MSGSRIILWIFTVSCILYNAGCYNFDITDWTLALSSSFFTYHIIRISNLWKDLCSIILLVVVFLSVVFLATFQLTGPFYKFDDFTRLASFGNRIFFEFSALILFTTSSRKRGKKKQTARTPKAISENLIVSIFIISSIFLTFAYLSGSMYMGDTSQRARIVLPFHLNGIINVFIIFFLPYLFSIIIENEILTKGKIKRSHLVFIFIFGLVETFVRLSKSALLYTLLPTMIVMYMYYKPSLIRIIKLGTPFVVLVLFLYPIVGMMRKQDNNLSVEDKMRAAYSDIEEGEQVGESSNVIIASFNRQFLTGTYYMKYYEYINDSEPFDFSNAQKIIAAGGGAGYVTHVIDGYALGSGHSTGTTGTLDALMFGGYGFCYLLMLIIPFAASIADNYRIQECISVRIVMVFFVTQLFNEATISQIIPGSLYATYFLGYLIAAIIGIRVNLSTRAYKSRN